MIQTWYEVWVDESTTIPYVLFICPDPSCSGGILVIDPKQDNKVIQRLSDYDKAVFWLTEDEYTRVDGRMAVD